MLNKYEKALLDYALQQYQRGNFSYTYQMCPDDCGWIHMNLRHLDELIAKKKARKIPKDKLIDELIATRPSTAQMKSDAQDLIRALPFVRQVDVGYFHEKGDHPFFKVIDVYRWKMGQYQRQ